MMKAVRLPKDSKRYVEVAFQEKDKWHRKNVRMSFTRKMAVLDTLLEKVN